jgi:hypothetical protein
VISWVSKFASKFHLYCYTEVTYDDGDVEVLDLIGGAEKCRLLARADGSPASDAENEDVAGLCTLFHRFLLQSKHGQSVTGSIVHVTNLTHPGVITLGGRMVEDDTPTDSSRYVPCN